MIAGAVTRDEQLGMQGIPLLQSVPVAGWMFKQESRIMNQSEILIIMTPHVISGLNPPNTFAIPIPEFTPR